jgi:hypothetical protein
MTLSRGENVKPTITDERMYQAGLLRIAMHMRKEPSKDFESLFQAVTKELRLDPADFRKYVHANMQSLMVTAKQMR